MQDSGGEIMLAHSLAPVDEKVDEKRNGRKEGREVTDTESEEEDGGEEEEGEDDEALVPAGVVTDGAGNSGPPLQSPSLPSPGYVRQAAPAKRTVKKCEHGRQKSQCKDCKGEDILRQSMPSFRSACALHPDFPPWLSAAAVEDASSSTQHFLNTFPPNLRARHLRAQLPEALV